MSELPPGWTKASLEVLVDILDSARVPLNATERKKRVEGKPSDSLFPYYGATGQVDEINSFLFDEPLILLGEDGVPFFDRLRHKAYLVQGKCWVNNHAHVLRAIDAVADRRYLAGFLNIFNYNGFVTGSTRLKLTQAAMRSIPVSVAPLPEQKRIAGKLEAVIARVDAGRAHLDRVPGILKRFRQSVLANATTGELTREWREERGQPSAGMAVEHPVVKAEHGTWHTSLLPSGWQWLTFKEYFDDQTDSRRKLPQSAYEPSGQLAVVDQGEPLIGGYTSRTDLASRSTLPAIVFGDHTRCVKYVDFAFVQGADGVKVLVPRPKVALPAFAHLVLQACNLPNKGYSRHTRLLRASFFPRPPLEEQTEVLRRANRLFDLADCVANRCASADWQVTRMTPSVLSMAFRGELVPQDPNDESASMLLARLRTRIDSAGNANKSKLGRTRGSRTKSTADTNMLKRKDVTPTHLTMILKQRGALTAEALWTASRLEIDDFYDQLKDEEARGLLRENRGDAPTAPRVLEATA